MEPEIAVVVVPFPAQGHLNQLLHLSLLLSGRGLAVHFASSTTHNRQAKNRVHGWDADSVARIHFHDLPIPSFSSPPPDPYAPTKFPAHLQPALEASEHMRAPLAALLRSLSAASRRLVVIQEPLMAFAGRDATPLPNAEVYQFICVPAFFQLPNLWADRGDDFPEPRPEVLDLILASFEGGFTPEFRDFVRRRTGEKYETAGTLINTCPPIEGEFLHLYRQMPQRKKVFSIGPVSPVVLKRNECARHACIQWLDGQPPDSVVYVSFGTTSAIPDEQIKELALGLQRSGQRFIWVLRDADRGDIFANGGGNQEKRLPPEYERAVGGVGMVIRNWGPQLEILAHPSTGGFMSHCGWNSCMEGLSMGVPILAWPMHSDQPRNALMVTEYLKVGVVVREWDRRKEIVSSAEVEKAVKRLMVDDEGKEIRRRAEELGVSVRQAASEGGSSEAELSAFVSHITR